MQQLLRLLFVRQMRRPFLIGFQENERNVAKSKEFPCTEPERKTTQSRRIHVKWNVN